MHRPLPHRFAQRKMRDAPRVHEVHEVRPGVARLERRFVSVFLPHFTLRSSETPFGECRRCGYQAALVCAGEGGQSAAAVSAKLIFFSSRTSGDNPTSRRLYAKWPDAGATRDLGLTKRFLSLEEVTLQIIRNLSEQCLPHGRVPLSLLLTSGTASALRALRRFQPRRPPQPPRPRPSPSFPPLLPLLPHLPRPRLRLRPAAAAARGSRSPAPRAACRGSSSSPA